MPTPDPLAPLRDALTGSTGNPELADAITAGLKSAIRSVVPGRQQKKNLDPLLHDGAKAMLRTLRRRARK